MGKVIQMDLTAPERPSVHPNRLIARDAIAQVKAKRIALGVLHDRLVAKGLTSTLTGAIAAQFGDVWARGDETPAQRLSEKHPIVSDRKVQQQQRKEQRKQRPNYIAAKEFIRQIRAVTPCSRCGRKPVEFHREEHVSNPRQRVGSLVGRGAKIHDIQAEIALCEPLCRSCHMQEDGRLEMLHAKKPKQKGFRLPPRPCIYCRKLVTVTRKGRCDRCDAAVRKEGKRKLVSFINCRHCQASTIKYHHNQLFCSKSCKFKAQWQRTVQGRRENA